MHTQFPLHAVNYALLSFCLFLFHCQTPEDQNQVIDTPPDGPMPPILVEGKPAGDYLIDYEGQGDSGQLIRKGDNSRADKQSQPYHTQHAGRSIWENPDWASNTKYNLSNTNPAKHRQMDLQESSPEHKNALVAKPVSKQGHARGLPAGIPVLCYHHNFPGSRSFGGYNIRPHKLKAQLRYLQQAGYRTISMHQFWLYMQGRQASLPEKPIVLTFDDGLRSNYTQVLPLLKRYGMQATLFIYPGIIGKAKKNYLNWNELQKLVRSGHFEIGSHTLNHPRLPEHSNQEIRRQLVLSRKILTQKLGVRVNTVAYPFGVYDRRVIKAAHAAGYKLGFSIHPGANLPGMPNLIINRYMVTGAHSLAMFQKHLQLQSSAEIQVHPDAGSTVRVGNKLQIRMAGLKLESIKLGSHNMTWQRKDAYFMATVPEFKSKLGYLPISIRARTKDGQRVYREYLLLDASRFKRH